jgi:hypothetical protein
LKTKWKKTEKLSSSIEMKNGDWRGVERGVEVNVEYMDPVFPPDS